MRFGSFAALFALVVVVGACGGGGSAREPPPKPEFQPPADPLMGLVWKRNSADLAKLNPRTLAPGLDRVPVGTGAVVAFSPDRTTLALGYGEHPRVEFVDLKTMRSLGELELDMPAYVSRLSWPAPGMLFAAVGQQAIVVIDLARPAVHETRQVGGMLIAAQPVKAGLLGLVAPADRIGPLEVVIWGGKGTSSVPLRGMVGGWETEQGDDESDFRSREMVPGLAVDPAGHRALVVPPAGPVVELNLNNLRLRYHELSQPVSLFHRFLDWLDPAAEAKMIEGKDRQAVWLSNGLVAVSGVDYPPLNANQSELNPEPAGLLFIDTNGWSVREVSKEVTGFQLAGEHLLAFEGGCAGDVESFGFAAYDLRGNEQFQVCRDEGFDPQVAGRYVYAGFDDNTRFEVIDLATGQTVARLRTKQTTSLLVGY